MLDRALLARVLLARVLLAAACRLPLEESEVLRQGDQVPRFDVTTVDGMQVRYADLWQHKNLLLLALPADALPGSAGYIAELKDLLLHLPARDTAYVVTSDDVPRLRAPGTIVADRWGEIRFVREAGAAAGLPVPQDLAEWVQHVQHACPECEGEAR